MAFLQSPFLIPSFLIGAPRRASLPFFAGQLLP